MSGSATSERHHRLAEGRGPVGVALVTVSDSRTPETDVNGHFLKEAVPAVGHRVTAYHLVPDDPERVLEALERCVADEGTRAVLLNGGTGLSRRDNTHEALARRLETTIPGFGELFRMLSWEQVGAAAMLSRATAGVYRGCVVFSTPGSPAAVRLAWEKLVAPELEHLVWELGR